MGGTVRTTSRAYKAGYDKGAADAWAQSDKEQSKRIMDKASQMFSAKMTPSPEAETLRLLLEAEPGLEKYRTDGPWLNYDPVTGAALDRETLRAPRTWNLDGLRSALEFKRNQANAEALLGSPTIGLKSTGAEGKK